MTEGSTGKIALPNGCFSDPGSGCLTEPEVLRARVAELEAVCAEVYVAAVELGLPQALLNRLWTVAAKGRTPHAWSVDIPRAATEGNVHHEPMPIPDIKLTDRPAREGDTRVRSNQPEMKALADRRRVLVVDDDAMMMEVLVRILKRENYELITALSGPEAMRKLDDDPSPIDLLITDYAMPEMQGRELADRMRARYPSLRVLYQTGFCDMLFEHRAELEDNAAFLEKPFTARGLREAARFILFGALNPS